MFFNDTELRTTKINYFSFQTMAIICLFLHIKAVNNIFRRRFLYIKDECEEGSVLFAYKAFLINGQIFQISNSRRGCLLTGRWLYKYSMSDWMERQRLGSKYLMNQKSEHRGSYRTYGWTNGQSILQLFATKDSTTKKGTQTNVG